MEKPHQRLQPRLPGADDEAAERIGEQLAKGVLPVFHPFGVTRALGRRAVERDQAAGQRIVGDQRVAGRKGALPGIVDPEAHGLVAALQHAPALGRLAGREVGEPDENAVLRRGAGEELPGDFRLRILDTGYRRGGGGGLALRHPVSAIRFLISGLRFQRSGIQRRRRRAEQGGGGVQDRAAAPHGLPHMMAVRRGVDIAHPVAVDGAQ